MSQNPLSPHPALVQHIGCAACGLSSQNCMLVECRATAEIGNGVSIIAPTVDLTLFLCESCVLFHQKKRGGVFINCAAKHLRRTSK